jgi:hypothetical protein
VIFEGCLWVLVANTVTAGKPARQALLPGRGSHDDGRRADCR